MLTEMQWKASHDVQFACKLVVCNEKIINFRSRSDDLAFQKQYSSICSKLHVTLMHRLALSNASCLLVFGCITCMNGRIDAVCAKDIEIN